MASARDTIVNGNKYGVSQNNSHALEVLLSRITKWTGISYWRLAMGSVWTESRSLITPVELVVPQAREEVVLDGGCDGGLIKTPELAVRGNTRSDIKIAFLDIDRRRRWKQSAACDVLRQAVLSESIV